MPVKSIKPEDKAAKLTSSAAIAEVLGVSERTIRYRKHRLKVMGHAAFEDYSKGSWLNAQQVSTLKQWQRLADAEYKGKSLYDEILKDSVVIDEYLELFRTFAIENGLQETVVRRLMTLAEKVLNKLK